MTPAQSPHTQKSKPVDMATLSTMLLDIPSCITTASTHVNALTKTAATPTIPDTRIYDDAAIYIDYANTCLNNSDWGVKAMMDLWAREIDWNDVIKKGFLSGNCWDAQYVSIPSVYDYVLQVYDINGNRVFELFYGNLNDFPRGVAYYQLGLLGKVQGENVKVRVDFGTPPGEDPYLDVYIIGLDVNGTSDPERIVIHLKDDGTFTHISGSAYKPTLCNLTTPDIDHYFTPHEGFCYTFTGIFPTNGRKKHSETCSGLI